MHTYDLDIKCTNAHVVCKHRSIGGKRACERVGSQRQCIHNCVLGGCGIAGPWGMVRRMP